jgi:hypothetical protein
VYGSVTALCPLLVARAGLPRRRPVSVPVTQKVDGESAVSAWLLGRYLGYSSLAGLAELW